MEQALSGLRVLDFGHYIAGPYTAMLLAEQGAEVIKVERPGGDPCRGENGFMVWNRSKKGIVLNLKAEAGQRVAKELAKESDVIIENFSPGVADRLGIGFNSIKQVNPKLIYCAISGFGQEGAYRDVPGWDPMVGSVSGAFLEQGKGEGYPPIYLVSPLASYYSAFMAGFSIASALLAREITGKGQRVDISLFGSMLNAQCTAMVDFEGRVRSPWRDPQGSTPLYKFYQGSDGKWFFLALGNMGFFTKFAVALGHEEWLADPRFEGAPFLIFPPASNEIIALFTEIFAQRTRDEWLELLQSGDIPCAAARPVDEFLMDQQVMANGMITEIEEPGLGKVRQMGIPVKLGRTPGRIKEHSPRLGEHTSEVLTGLIRYSSDQITGLKESGII